MHLAAKSKKEPIKMHSTMKIVSITLRSLSMTVKGAAVTVMVVIMTARSQKTLKRRTFIKWYPETD
jgi:hypothetical protein